MICIKLSKLVYIRGLFSPLCSWYEKIISIWYILTYFSLEIKQYHSYQLVQPTHQAKRKLPILNLEGIWQIIDCTEHFKKKKIEFKIMIVF